MLRQLTGIGEKSSAAIGVILTWTTDCVVYWSWPCLCSSDVQRYFHFWNTKNNHLHLATRLHVESFRYIDAHLFMNIQLTNFQVLCTAMFSNENSWWTNNLKLFHTISLFPDIFSVWTNRSQGLHTHTNSKIWFNMMKFHIQFVEVLINTRYPKFWFLDITNWQVIYMDIRVE